MPPLPPLSLPPWPWPVVAALADLAHDVMLTSLRPGHHKLPLRPLLPAVEAVNPDWAPHPNLGRRRDL